MGGERCPPGGVLILERHAVFRRTSVGSVIFNAPPAIK